MGEFLHHFVEIITDPAHTAVEFCFVLFDYVIIRTVEQRLKRHFHKDLRAEHQRIEDEHGLEHPTEARSRETV